MVSAPSPAAIRGSTFVRLLARFTEGTIAPLGGSLPDRLGHWLDWKQSIALSTALDGKLAQAPAEAEAPGTSLEEQCRAAMATLGQSITEDAAWDRAVQRASHAPVTDFTAFRQRILTLQRSMQGTTGQLRGRLRDTLASGEPHMARLAEVDAVMEGVLSPREQGALALVPTLLGRHFERLRDASDRPDTSGPWLPLFRKDMQTVLLAELDVRFQPVEGLLAALRSHG